MPRLILSLDTMFPVDYDDDNEVPLYMVAARDLKERCERFLAGEDVTLEFHIEEVEYEDDPESFLTVCDEGYDEIVHEWDIP